MAHRHRSVPRNELIAAVWPETDEDSGRHRLHQAVYELRATLRLVDPDRSSIVCAGGGYGVDQEVPVWVDVDEFDELSATAGRCFAGHQAEKAIGLSQRALDLYRGDFLCQVTEADWATTERNRLRACFDDLDGHYRRARADRTGLRLSRSEPVEHPRHPIGRLAAGECHLVPGLLVIKPRPPRRAARLDVKEDRESGLLLPSVRRRTAR